MIGDYTAFLNVKLYIVLLNSLFLVLYGDTVSIFLDLFSQDFNLEVNLYLHFIYFTL